MRLNGKVALALLCSSLVGTSAAHAGEQARANYKRSSPVFAGGYTDKELSPGSWKVSSTIGGAKPYYLSEKVALYRSAELVEQAGFEYVRIDAHKATRYVSRGAYYGPAGAAVELKVTGVNLPVEPGNCTSAVTMLCRSFPARVAKVEMRRFLNFDS